MPRVVFITSLSEDLVRLILGYAPPGFDTAWLPARAPDEEKTRLAQDADFMILYPGRISEPVLRACKRLRHIQVLSAGYEGMDLALTDALGIPVSNNGGANSWAVAEATIALILALLRRLMEADAFVRAGKWRGTLQGYDTYELAGKTVGIVGLGNIGKKVARRLHAFETHLVYADEVPDPALEQELGLTRVALDQLLATSDVVTLHVPLLPSTRGLMGRRELGLMKPSAVLINTCRGPVVDEAALIAALQEERLRGAGLDVFSQEPIAPDSPLLGMPNVALMAHLAGTTYDTFFRRAQFAFENIRGIWEGNAPMAVVQPEA